MATHAPRGNCSSTRSSALKFPPATGYGLVRWGSSIQWTGCSVLDMMSMIWVGRRESKRGRCDPGQSGPFFQEEGSMATKTPNVNDRRVQRTRRLLHEAFI